MKEWKEKVIRKQQHIFLELFPNLPHTLEELMEEWYGMAYEKYANELILKKGAFDFLQEVHQRGIKAWNRYKQ